jgi:DNA polymerase-3 subunit gamma/tau
MASLALYLKWRPQRFEDVVGQEHVTRTLKNALLAGRISHAYLFAGPRGTGKTTMARLLAKAVNCLDPDVANRPCNRCSICQSINQGRLLDLIEIDAASNTGVDNVREAIRDKVGFRPTEARYKVYVIDEVHMLSTSAFNALLKTLEEPPEHVIFCLATTEPHRVLPTVLSRCQQFDFHRIPLAALVARLRLIADEEGIHIEDSALQFIARASTGCARDAIGLLDQLTAYGDEVITVERLHAVLGMGDAHMVHELAACMIEHDIGRGLDVIDRVLGQGADMRQFALQVVEYLRALLLLRVAGGANLLDIDAQTLSALGSLVDQVSVRDLVRWIKLLNQAQMDLRGSDQSQIGLELAFVEAALMEESPPGASAASAPVPAAAAPVAAQTVVASAAPAREPSRQTHRPTGGGAPPAAPPRSAAQETRSVVPAATGEADKPSSAPASPGNRVSLEDVQRHLDQIMQAIKVASPPVATFVNSAVSWDVQPHNQVVLEFSGARNDPSYNFAAMKLEEEGNKRIVEHALSSVLSVPCQVRSIVRSPSAAPSSPPAKETRSSALTAPAMPEAAGQEDAEPAVTDEGPSPAADLCQEAYADPVVQDLIDRGGEVTDVQAWPEE